MSKALQLKFATSGRKVSKKKISQYLDKVIDRRLRNMQVDVANNYRRTVAHSDFLSVIDFIENNSLILGGGATIFLNHNQKDNPVIYYLMDNMAERSMVKKRNKTLPEGSFALLMGEISSSNIKLKNNVYYGAIGTPYFRFHNVFIAEAITMTGRNIICTAAMGFEGFLGDNMYFNELDEVYQYIINIANEYNDNYKGKELSKLSTMPDITNEMVYNRIIDRCAFTMTNKMKENLFDVIVNLGADIKVLVYFKNNLYAFLRIPVIIDRFTYIVQNIGILRVPDIRKIENPEIADLLTELWEAISIYVYYNHPTYDRIRKTLYTDKKSVFYIDTDSNFLGLNEFVQFTKNDVLDRRWYGLSEKDIEFATVNIITIFLSYVVRENLYTMGRQMQVPEEFVPKLDMKNEFYFARIIFTAKKKRYIALKILQEGRLLNNGLGKEELKGFDFKKSVTKTPIKNFYTDLCLDEVLRAETIDTRAIFRKLKNFEHEMRQSLLDMEPTYYKQAAIQEASHYKIPYSNSGYKALVLWNTLCPNYALQPPAYVDILPIKELNYVNKGKEGVPKKPSEGQTLLMEKYPETYELLYKNILCNKNELIRNMSLNYIAVPRGMDYEIPPWLKEIVDVESIVNANISMITSITDSIGLTTLIKGKSGKPHLSNIIEL